MLAKAQFTVTTPHSDAAGREIRSIITSKFSVNLADFTFTSLSILSCSLKFKSPSRLHAMRQLPTYLIISVFTSRRMYDSFPKISPSVILKEMLSNDQG